MLFSRDRSTALPICEVDGCVLPEGDVGKCLGYWWRGDLLATKCVIENSLKPTVPFSTMGVSVCFRVLVPFVQVNAGHMCELDNDGGIVGEVGGFFGVSG